MDIGKNLLKSFENTTLESKSIFQKIIKTLFEPNVGLLARRNITIGLKTNIMKKNKEILDTVENIINNESDSEETHDPLAIKVEQKTVFSNLVDEMRKTLRYYMKTSNQAFFNKFYIAGGSAQMDGLQSYIAENLNVEVSMLNPFDNTECSLDIENPAQYGEIKKKMLQLINNNQTAFFRDLKSVKQKYLKNTQNDIVRWGVDADGIAGETSGGSIKQDVTIQIFADGKRILRSELNFSLKSDSASIHGGGLYNSMPEIFEMFQGLMPNSKVNEGKKYLKSIINKRGHEETSKNAINAVWMLVGNAIPKKPNIKLSDHFWDILEKRLFGSSNSYKGKIQLLEMNKNELSEITKAQFKKLRNSGILLYPTWLPNENPKEATPGTIKIMPIYPGDGGKVKKTVETDTNKEMFKIRISYEWTKQDVGGKKIRLQHGQAGAKSAPSKVLIELGRKKSIVHDENWDKFVEAGLVVG